MHFTWVSQPCNAKNTVNTTVFDSMDGGGVEPTTSGLQAARAGVNIDSINKSAGPAPGIFLAKARGTPASTASFRENIQCLSFPRASQHIFGGRGGGGESGARAGREWRAMGKGERGREGARGGEREGEGGGREL